MTYLKSVSDVSKFFTLMSNSIWYQYFTKESELKHFQENLKEAAKKGGIVGAPVVIGALSTRYTRKQTKNIMKRIGKKILAESRRLRGPRILGGAARVSTGTSLVALRGEENGDGEGELTHSQKDFPPPIAYFVEYALADENLDSVLQDDLGDAILLEILPGLAGGVLPVVILESGIPIIGAVGAFAQKKGWQVVGQALSRVANSKIATSPITKTTIIGLGIAGGIAGANFLQNWGDDKMYNNTIEKLTREKLSLEKQIRSQLASSSKISRLATSYASVMSKFALMKAGPTIGTLEVAMTQYYSDSVCDPLLAAESGFSKDSAFREFHAKSKKKFLATKTEAYKLVGLTEGLKILNDGLIFLQTHLQEKAFLATSTTLQNYYHYFKEFEDQKKFTNKVENQSENYFQESLEKSSTLEDLHQRFAKSSILKSEDLPTGEVANYSKAIRFFYNSELEIEVGGFPFKCSYTQFPKWFPSTRFPQSALPKKKNRQIGPSKKKGNKK